MDTSAPTVSIHLNSPTKSNPTTIIINGPTVPATDSPSTSSDNFTIINGYVVAHIAGTYRNNNQWGIGVWFGPNDQNNVSKVLNGSVTDNRADILACIEALEILNRKKYKKAKIFTCNDWLSKCITFNWIGRWSQNNWRTREGSVVKNKDILLRLAEIKAEFFGVVCISLVSLINSREMEEAKKLASSSHC